jgi:tetratricopeptide (TPR) repeat protein
VLYQDRPHLVRRIHSNLHVYRDWHDRICHRIIWPRYHFPVYYHWGPSRTVRYVYPYHLRKYVFVSLGGYWPIEYRYTRYYWYGYHPYYWCGYYPVAREVVGDTYNYYTYSYYYGDDGAVYSEPAQVIDGIQPVDHTTFADVRERLAQEAAEPGEPTLADGYFEEAVEAFEAGDYKTAIEKFGVAMELAPDDMVLPFAYAQALMANEQYSEAAEILRTALENVSPEKEGVFYPRGLYPDDDVLLEQIARLAEKADVYAYDADLQLLLGYQRLGMGEAQEALDPLQRAVQDLENATAAKVLIDLAEKIITADGEVESPTE